MNRTAIIGFGCAGYHAARTMRELGYKGEIHVFDGAPKAVSNPMLTTYHVAGKVSYDGMFPFGDIKTIERDLDLTGHWGTRVAGIRPSSRAVILEDGSETAFDSLLLSTGATPFCTPLKGADERLFVMRTPEDAVGLKARLEKGSYEHAVVVGASMVGIKVAEVLHDNGIRTRIVDMQTHMFPIVAYPNVAREIERRLAALGIECVFGTSVDAMTERGVRLNNGDELPADLVGLCIGVRACTQLGKAEPEGKDVLKIGRGYSVDRQMQTSVPGIYAAGDCCEGYDLQSGANMVLGLWDNARMQGETAGSNMAGVAHSYPGNVINNITHFFGTDFIGVGDIRRTGEHFATGSLSGDDYIEAVIDGDELCSLNLLGNPRISGIVQNYFKKRMVQRTAEFSYEQLGVLLRNGVNREFLDRLTAAR